jgi:hypothetical protein
MSPENLYKPHLATILEIRQEATGARGIKTFKMLERTSSIFQVNAQC